VLGLFASFYYWWPKVFGRMLSERLGKINFWLMIIGLNLTFGPMHILGLQGQPRRMYRYAPDRVGQGFFDLTFWNLVSSIGAFILATGILFFVINVVRTSMMKKGEVAPADPWDARSLEWMTTNPPKPYNWDTIPTVHTLDEFFHRKYAENEETGEIEAIATGEEVVAELAAHTDAHMHMPSPSYWPIVLAFGLPIIGYGVIFNRLLIVVGAAIVLLGAYGWALEPSVAEPSDYDPPPAEGGGESKELATVG